MVLTLETTS